MIEMVKRWSKRNEVVVVCSYGAKATLSYRSKHDDRHHNGLRVVVLDSSTLTKMPDLVSWIGRLAMLILRRPNLDPNVVFAPSDFLWDVLPCVLVRLTSPRTRVFGLVWHLIPPPFRRPGTSLSSNLLSYVAQRVSLLILEAFADGILVPNRVVRDEMRHILGGRLSDQKICVAPGGGIEYGKLAGVPQQVKTYDACFLGRLHPAKGIFDLVQVWRRVVANREDARLAIIGGGPVSLVRRLEKDIERSRLKNNVFLVGDVPHELVPGLLKKSKILIQPSLEEGFSIAVCEALACGLPVIAYDLPIYREVYGDAVLCVPTGDLGALARETGRLIADKKRISVLARRGLKEARRHDWNCIANKISRLMQGSAGRAARGNC